MWIDEACVDEQRVSLSLAGLPVCLAGSKQLLVLLGPSLTTRLWALIELYTFLKMGVSADRVCVLPLASMTSERMRESIDQFDVHMARCFLENDRQHILSIIEAGFGGSHRFNERLRLMLNETLAPAVVVA